MNSGGQLTLNLTLNDAAAFDKDEDDYSTCSSAEIIENNFQGLLSGQMAMTDLLPMLDRALQLEAAAPAQAADDDDLDLGALMVALLHKHGKQETELAIVLQVLYQILNTLQPAQMQELQLNGAVLEALIALCISAAGGQSQRQTLANILSCVQLSVHKLKLAPTNDALKKLWLHLSQQQQASPTSSSAQPPLVVVPPRSAQILVQLFDEFEICMPDEFHRSPQLIAITQQLLVSSVREERKMACFLIKKVLCVVVDRSQRVSAWELDTSTALTRNWSVYLTIMENLEENQSHLILPSLEALKSIERQHSWHSWLDILYMRVLAHNNVLVMRWAIEYLLATFKCAELSPQVLQQLLQALNTTNLYNGEGGGYFLPQSNIANFLTLDKIAEGFWEKFAGVNWKSVPLHFWLAQLHKRFNAKQPLAGCSKELLLKIAARVRVLQNPKIRQHTIRLFEQIFARSIEELTVAEYVQLIETLYNVMDFYWTRDLQSWNMFLKKLQRNGNRPIDNDTFSKRFYDILTNYIDFDLVDLICAQIPALFKLIDVLPSESHGWLRFLVVFHAVETKEKTQFCFKTYKIDSFSIYFKLEEVLEHFHKQLVWDTSEVAFVRESAVDWFVKTRINNFVDIINNNLDFEKLVCSDMGTKRTLLKISGVLCNWTFRINDKNFNFFLQGLKKISKTDIYCSEIVGNILTYCKKQLTPAETSKHAMAILNFDFKFADSPRCKNIFEEILLSTDCYVRGILSGDAQTGDARVEEFYENDVLRNESKIMQMRFYYINGARNADAKAIVLELLNKNNELSRNKPRYFENSKEHRLKLRIAIALSNLTCKILPYWKDDLWNILLEQNNQPNVTYLFEIFIARCVPNVDAILAQLQKVPQYTASQQVSVICVTHAYCISLLNKRSQWKALDQIVHILLPLTMGANFQTRTYSQLVIYSILTNCSQNSIVLPQPSAQLQATIKAAVGDQMTELLDDVRLKWPFLSPIRLEEQIMYITDAPFDEYNRSGISLNSDILKSRKQFAKKHRSSLTKHTPQTFPVDALNNDIAKIQRKMNPTNDVVLQNNLITYPNEKSAEIYVVASLVDKLPNLGGIARTCEVLGINNLVMDSKSSVEKCDFKNLSMTAEKGLNIIEIKPAALSDFLIQKQIEGFKIVGAEQTANSESFVGFEFPKKCVLLLGHEKEGIPANLLGFLDHAVEIPQFGMVRSLNVHVTGALFMWEYCKQHIIEN